jgi:hypothetical protein
MNDAPPGVVRISGANRTTFLCQAGRLDSLRGRLHGGLDRDDQSKPSLNRMSD